MSVGCHSRAFAGAREVSLACFEPWPAKVAARARAGAMRRYVMLKSLSALAGLCVLPMAALAQPFNVRAWYAEGQVFVVWQMPAPPGAPTDTVEIYASPAVQATTANMQLVGRLFFPEYTGGRLNALLPGARLLV